MVPGLMERYTNIFDPGMGPYPPRERRDLDLGQSATLTARWLHEPQLMSDHPVELGFHTLRGAIDPEDLIFRPRVVGVVEIWKDF